MLQRAIHPDEILQGELDVLNVLPSEFAREIDVPANRIDQIIAGKRSITTDSALRFGHWFGVNLRFWIKVQSQPDLATAHRKIGAVFLRFPSASSRTSGMAR